MRLALPRKLCAKAVPEMDSLTQQKQYHKRTTLRTTKLPLRSICSKEGPHYRLGAKCKEAVRRQATINPIHEFGYPLGAVLHSLANSRKCQFKESEEERYESCSVQRTFTAETFSKKVEKEKFNGSEATTRFPRASCFEKPAHSVPETWGHLYDVLALRN
jgi:hypothetical protein